MKNSFQWKGSRLEAVSLLLLFIAYLASLSYVVFFAWNYGSSFGPVGPGGRNYNLEPFLSIYNISQYSTSLENPIRILGGNIVLFIPFGFLFPLILERFRKNKKKTKMLVLIFAAALLSAFIEINQYIFTYRVANVDDVILNTSGAFIGYIVYLWYRRSP
ncbi:VanZ family protein [Alkalicoccus daliensis]|uniref:VanZ like family protein n=1 Tax=Alkalicoccus daliensis TaxID=745820 RepID=A0A1H0AF50_9BACI|nr:VanZ family protein [Alkalicoccus daliensis]SDN31416.1 VanZ like family protein [Alkalicoccus daliensis]